MCVCVCERESICVQVREREREREGEVLCFATMRVCSSFVHDDPLAFLHFSFSLERNVFH